MLEWLLRLDRTVFTQINMKWSNSWFDLFFPFITDLHKTLYFKLIFVPLVALIIIWRRGLKKGLIIFLFCIAAAGTADHLGTTLFKNTIQRPRPFKAVTEDFSVMQRSPAGGYSFVSNHAVNNFAVATFLTLFFPEIAVVAYTIAFLVMYSRVYNGVHYPSDVIAGALWGALCGWIFYLGCRRLLAWIESRQKGQNT